MEHEKHPRLILPVEIISRIDVGRLLRETEGLDNYMRQAGIREKSDHAAPPRMSRLFNEIISANKLNIRKADDRKSLAIFLASIKKSAPSMHMSFTADPSPAVMAKLMTWLRKEIHPYLLLQTGLQPTIGAGCVVRTRSKYFDFSLRKRLTEERHKLTEIMHHLGEAPPKKTIEIHEETS